MSDEAPVKRWTAKCKSAVVIDIFKGKITPVEEARQHDLTVAKVERWIEEPERNMENGFCSRPKDVREQCEKELQETREALGDGHLQIYALKSIGACSTTRRTREVAAGRAPGRRSSCLAQQAPWLAGRPEAGDLLQTKARPKATDPAQTDRVKLDFPRFPTYRYRRLAIVLGENKKPIQRNLQIKGLQVRKRPQGFRPGANALPSVTHQPDQRWATEICHVWCGRDRSSALAAVIDLCTREILGWRLSSSGTTATAEAP